MKVSVHCMGVWTSCLSLPQIHRLKYQTPVWLHLNTGSLRWWLRVNEVIRARPWCNKISVIIRRDPRKLAFHFKSIMFFCWHGVLRYSPKWPWRSGRAAIGNLESGSRADVLNHSPVQPRICTCYTASDIQRYNKSNFIAVLVVIAKHGIHGVPGCVKWHTVSRNTNPKRSASKWLIIKDKKSSYSAN